MTIAIVVVAFQLRDEQGPLDAETTAVDLVSGGVAQESRWDGDRWEVDVVKRDGSIVQVNLSEDLRLRSIDEELGPGGTLAEDELRGDARVRAVRAAFAEVGPGQVTSVERDSPRKVKVRLRDEEGEHLGVVLDASLEVVRVDDEDPRDE